MAHADDLRVVTRTKAYGQRPAIVDSFGTYSYAELLDASGRIATALLSGRDDLHEGRIAFRMTPGFPWVATQWGIWRAGGVAVPLALDAPASELDYYLSDSQVSALVYGETAMAPLAVSRGLDGGLYSRLLSCERDRLPEVTADRCAMILYTSGTTSRPKGVVTTHANIAAQITALVEAWEWSCEDHILLCLPLHHIHGIVNVVGCALWSGATCEMLPRFDASAVWERIASGSLTLFMAVPTIYVRLISAWDAASPERQTQWTEAAARLRLMVSGSAALPVTTLQRWKKITGHTLLERYGMTEMGMALSNPYRGERVPGTVGKPLPGVEVRLVSESGEKLPSGAAGEIEVRGPNVFKEYWENPIATLEAFHDGWFRTGDTAIVENDVFRILGRSSIDIIKSGGHKISALEIEEVLRTHPAIAECAVVGVPDSEWGERVAAAVVVHTKQTVDLETLRAWCKQRMAAHKVPSRLLTLEALPRNAMGKVIKTSVTNLFRHSGLS